MPDSDFVFYGSHLDAIHVESTLSHLFRINLEVEEGKGVRPIPICIWGTHGLGKTFLVKEFAK